MADSKDGGTRSDGFLNRWSRRKQDVRSGVPVAEVPPPSTVLVHTPPAALDTKISKSNQPLDQQNIARAAINNVAISDSQQSADALPPAPTIDDVKALTLESDFKPFMVSNVSPEVKNAAMKKLFTDPHYNVMDMMDTYVDDYSKEDPIPESMLKELVASKFLKLFERDEEDGKVSEEKIENAAQTRDDADSHSTQTVAQLPPSAPIDVDTLGQPPESSASPR